MIKKRVSPNRDKITVIFEIPGSIWAERVNLVGDFNHWDTESLPFKLGRDENWYIELELDVGQSYRFRYLFDGSHWRDEWQADKYVPNPHGGYDSIVVAELPPAG